MAQRLRLIIDTEERHRKAVQLRAFKLSVERRKKVSPSDVINELIESELADELAEVDNGGGDDHDDSPPKRKTK